MAYLTYKQERFLAKFIDQHLRFDKEFEPELKEILEALDKNAYYEITREDVLTVLDEYNEEGDFTFPPEKLETVIYRAMNYDNSDYMDFIRYLIDAEKD